VSSGDLSKCRLRTPLTIPQEEVALKIKKTVTDKQLAANRRNAELSTGPRTDVGKNFAKFNAIKHGLSAKHVFIPGIDGTNPKEFSSLLDGLLVEYDPQGPTEQFLVAKMAKAMWRMRRASLAEKGSIGTTIGPVQPPFLCPEYYQTLRELTALEAAREEIRVTGTVSPATYSAILPLLDERDQAVLPATKPLASSWMLAGGTSSDGRSYDKELSDAVDRKCENLRAFRDELKDRDDHLIMNHLNLNSIPYLYMNAIILYETRAENEFDWALARLLECQQRRHSKEHHRHPYPDLEKAEEQEIVHRA
jgi:hypothetical protein